MKAQKFWLVLWALLIAGIGTSFAHGGGRVGIYVGPYWGPLFYPPPYYYPPRVVVVPAPAPPVYIEQQQEAPVEAAPAPATAAQYWYYCASSKGYYPYVKECPEGWQKVLPQPLR
ncbi:MAG: hypothetical protein CVU16_14145 [Betaproteobacteria bacterium HGW-Betaproteobacteria-10]|nr:MAG: hypothetical protein CVU16_14145 [Betaproteobacteria bacterium HGW-Betaproteobacteria-10]